MTSPVSSTAMDLAQAIAANRFLNGTASIDDALEYVRDELEATIENHGDLIDVRHHVALVEFAVCIWARRNHYELAEMLPPARTRYPTIN